ncbi:MAG: type II secretion system F family protein [Pirellula sp.]
MSSAHPPKRNTTNDATVEAKTNRSSLLPKQPIRATKPSRDHLKSTRENVGQADETSSPTNASTWESVFGGISLNQLESFCSRMATGLRSGVDVLRLLESESKHGSSRHRQVIDHMILSVRQGESLSGAMTLQGSYFPVLLTRMLKAGEHSGRVEHCFQEMADHYRNLKRARSTFMGQVAFPLISLGIGLGVITLVIFINGFLKSGSPNEPAFDITGIGLRGGTGVLIFWSVIALIGGTIGVIAFGIWKNWFGCHHKLVPLVRNVPVIGPVFTTSALSRLSMTLSMMLGAGVDARRSAREALMATGNFYYISGIEQVEESIRQGKSFSEALDAPKLLPSEFIQTVEIGELSGSDSESLERLAIVYREQAEAALSKFAVVSGVAVWMMIAGLIVFAIFTIFFQIMKVYSDAMNF